MTQVDRRVVTSSRLGPADARFHWLRDTFPSDQFLLYCFPAPRDWPDGQAEHYLDRARRVADLNLRVRDVPGSLHYPLLVPNPVPDDSVTVHRMNGNSWIDCLDTVAELIGDQLRPEVGAWRLHLLGPVWGSPAGPEPVVVVVLQISHVLGDGRRTSAIARELLGDSVLPELDLRSSFGDASRAAVTGAASFPRQFAQTLKWGLASVGESRTASASSGAPPPDGVPVTVLNRPSGGRRLLRTVMFDRRTMTPPGSTVTATALAAISQALGRYLDLDAGHPLAAELTIARPPQPGVRNNFRNEGIALPLDLDDLGDRARLITEDIRRARAGERNRPLTAARRADLATPPVLQRLGARNFDPTSIIPDRMSGVTVVSSVHRGPADLTIGSRASHAVDPTHTAPALFTAGFPALSPMQGLTHGVHGLGDAVVVSVTTSPDVMPDVDRYVNLLCEAFDALGGAGAL